MPATERALDLAIEPLRPLFDDIVAPSLARRPDGTYRGELTDVPPTGSVVTPGQPASWCSSARR